MNFVVTGANGFLGRALVGRARLAEFEVLELVRGESFDRRTVQRQLGDELSVTGMPPTVCQIIADLIVGALTYVAVRFVVFVRDTSTS